MERLSLPELVMLTLIADSALKTVSRWIICLGEIVLRAKIAPPAKIRGASDIYSGDLNINCMHFVRLLCGYEGTFALHCGI